MQCTAFLASGKQCARPAAPGSQACALHDPSARRRRASAFYARDLPRRDQRLLEEAAQLAGVENEVAALRLVIEKQMSEADYEAARRAIDALGRLLRNRHAMTDGAGQITSWLDSVLVRMQADRLARFGKSLEDSPDSPPGDVKTPDPPSPINPEPPEPSSNSTHRSDTNFFEPLN